MPWPDTDPDGPAVVPSSPLDAHIADAAKALFLARDLVRPGPGLLPFGSRARDRREHRRVVDAVAATRRAELHDLLSARRNNRAPRTGRSVGRGRPRVVAAVLTAVVIAVAVAGWWTSVATTPPVPSPDVADTGSAATDPPNHEPAPAAPAARPATDPTPGPVAVLLSSPEVAAVSWLAAWCPIDPQRNPDGVAARIREAMTAAGWAQFAATPGHTAADAERGLTASCDTPRARIVSRPPGTDGSVVVLVTATRTLTDTDTDTDTGNVRAARSFRIERRQHVLRGADGHWRVDVAAVGG